MVAKETFITSVRYVGMLAKLLSTESAGLGMQDNLQGSDLFPQHHTWKSKICLPLTQDQ